MIRLDGVLVSLCLVCSCGQTNAYANSQRLEQSKPTTQESTNSVQLREMLSSIDSYIVYLNSQELSQKSRMVDELFSLRDDFSKYYKDLQRLFFFKSQNLQNAEKIKSHITQYKTTFNSVMEKDPVLSSHHENLEDQFRRWTSLHQSYGYYVGYFF